MSSGWHGMGLLGLGSDRYRHQHRAVVAGTSSDDEEVPSGMKKSNSIIAHQEHRANRVEQAAGQHPPEHRARHCCQNWLHGGRGQPPQQNVRSEGNAVESRVK